MAFSGIGAFAEMGLAAKDKVMRMPVDMSFNIGAAFGITYATAIHALQECGRLQPGESVLVLGAEGGVGLASIEVAKANGARVIAAASTDEKLELCRKMGAAVTINYSKEDLRLRALNLTDGGMPIDTEAQCLEKIKAMVGWDLTVAPNLKWLLSHDEKDLILLRLFDPRGYYIGS